MLTERLVVQAHPGSNVLIERTTNLDNMETLSLQTDRIPHSCVMSLWRNRLARSAVNRKVGGSRPPRDERFHLIYNYFGQYRNT